MRVLLGVAASLALLGPSSCGRSPATEAEKAPPPAKVEHPVSESDLTTVRLRPEAEARLGLKTAPVESSRVPDSRTFGGVAVVPLGRKLTVSAPFAGVVRAPSGNEGSRAIDVGVAAQVEKGTPVLLLEPLLGPEARQDVAVLRVDTAGRQEKAKRELEAAKVALARAEETLRSGTGTRGAVEEAKARVLVAGAELDAAAQRLQVFADLEAVTGEQGRRAVTIPSPLDGRLQDLYVAPGQAVAGGAPLFEVADLGRLWIRVPVYAGDLADLDLKSRARFAKLGEEASAAGVFASADLLWDAPFTADAGASSVDLYFEPAEDAPGLVAPGAKVQVLLQLKSAAESAVVPWSAIVHDVHGGTWVYELSAPHTFVRRRVEVSRVDQGRAVLARGPAVGTPVVSEGAAELYGTEFFAGK
jgi:biotin carboxyl carrier protein